MLQWRKLSESSCACLQSQKIALESDEPGLQKYVGPPTWGLVDGGPLLEDFICAFLHLAR